MIGNISLLDNGNYHRSGAYRQIPPSIMPYLQMHKVPIATAAAAAAEQQSNRYFLPYVGKIQATNVDPVTISVQNILYHKLDLIREGQSSCVLEVMDNSGVRYALKLVDFNHWNAAERADAYRMFTKELQFLARLGSQSNRIARVFAYEMNDITKTGKILMELGSDDFRSLLPLRDHPIRKIIQEPRRRYFWRQMVEAVHVVHANRIAHSDVKPENFILVNGKLKLIDFGMSFYIPPGLSSLLRPIAGTPDYMPPEVCRSHTTFAVFGYQADVWSLGCILYEMTFGYRPFEHVIGNADKIMTIASMRKALPIPACSSPSIRHLLSRCLHVKPSDRPSTAQILAHPYLTSNAI